VPLLVRLKLGRPFFVVNTLGLGNSLEHIIDSGHHSLKTAKVDVGAVFELLENFIGVFLDLVLDVHLSSIDVFLFTGEGVVETEVVGVALLGLLEFVVIKESIRVGNSKEQPGLSLVGAAAGVSSAKRRRMNPR